MNLRWIFSDFLVQHCADCLHHTSNGDTSWGSKIIHDYREKELKRAQNIEKEQARITQLRSELRSQSQKIIQKTGNESYRIVEFIEALFSEDETECADAAKQLKQSARLAPDLFPSAAINLLAALAGSKEFSKLILPVCAELAKRRADDFALCFQQMAFDNLEKHLFPERSAAVLDALGNAVAYPLEEKYLEGVLLSQDHHRPIGDWPEGKPDYSHSTTVLIRSFDADPESVQRIIRRELQNENDYLRAQLCGAIKLIQRDRPQIALNLLKELTSSLELYENGRLSSDIPSARIVQIFQSAFKYDPQSVDQWLAEAMKRVRPAVQEDVIWVYRDQFFDRDITSGEERKEQRNRQEISAQEHIAIQRLLAWIQNDQFEIDIRAEAVEALKRACEDAPFGMLKHFDLLFGYLAIISGKETPPALPVKIILPNQPEQDPELEEQDKLLRQQQWGEFQQLLQDCLEKLCEDSPAEAFKSVGGCLQQPFEHIEEDFRGYCVYLLGAIGKDYSLRTHILPILWRVLMDYNSPWVRAKAIEATVEMFSSSGASPPANLVDTIFIHLQDPKVIVHKAALRAVRQCPHWFDKKQTFEVLSCLKGHLQAYRDDEIQLDRICDALLSVSRRHERLKLLALRMVELLLPTGKQLVDKSIAEYLLRFCEPDDKIAYLVAQDIGQYLGRCDRDRNNYYGHSRRGWMFNWLHRLPQSTFQQAAKELLTSACEMAKRDAWESCHFASLFSSFGAFREEQIILAAAAHSLSDEPRYKSFRSNLKQLKKIAAGNAAVQSGDQEAAKLYFVTGSDGF
ncbi:MAG: hypothetical protein Q3M24_12375 [Candidatus Electrothrix aestuarii]|uniref:HEAT repeat-containing protein n=1 Tax=Candidatus Electrothrix aestuarii TaxID=3062594 RepID=A0AAU8LPI6_9BACT|nr:hypothetical protein [Candidatus Electrothrix aestuarii]